MLSLIIINLIIKNSNIFAQLRLKSANKILEEIIVIKKINNENLSEKIDDKILLKYENIKILNICNNKNVTNEGIKNLVNLTHLDCRLTKITDEGIKNLVDLTHLNCFATKITDEGIKNLVNLTYLDCRYRNLGNEGIKNLKYLNC